LESYTQNCAIRIVYKYCFKGYREAVNFVKNKGVEEAVQWAESNHEALSKAQRDDNFTLELKETDEL
jgi:hypothetical protein